MPGAKVTLTSTETGAQRESTSNEAGTYEFTALQPGGYRLAFQKEGFAQVTSEAIRLEVNQVARLDVSMHPGAVSENIHVTAAAALLESSNAQIGQVIETKAVSDLPLNGRNFAQLAILGTGVVGVGFGPSGTIGSGTRPDDPRPGAELMSNGNREMANDYLLDGVDDNFRRNGLITLRPTVEDILEFKIQTNLFGAEQGRNSGATVDVVTKSGTNNYHGSLFELLRNNDFDARNFSTRSARHNPRTIKISLAAALAAQSSTTRFSFSPIMRAFASFRERLRASTQSPWPQNGAAILAVSLRLFTIQLLWWQRRALRAATLGCHFPGI
jgi:hypothetical protein